MKKRVLITCSAKGGLPYWWFSSYDQILRMNHPEYEFEFAVESGNSAINISRNIASQTAIEGDYWKLLQIDKDQFWTPAQAIQLVSNTEPIVAGPYCKKKGGPVKWLIVTTPGAVPRADHLVECDFMGTGMICHEVAALKMMGEFFPERKFVYEDEDGITKEMTELFPIGLVGPNTPEGRLARIKKVVTGNEIDPATCMEEITSILHDIHPDKARLLGEDYHHSHLARKAGFKLYCDPRSVIGHVGEVVYPLTSEQLSVPAGFPSHTLNLNEW